MNDLKPQMAQMTPMGNGHDQAVLFICEICVICG